jgi:NitT/TauT family transport system substrate-binding protein
MRDAHVMNGNKYIGAMDPAAYGRIQDFMVNEKIITKTVPPQSLLISTVGFIEAVNKFDQKAVIADAKSCKGL